MINSSGLVSITIVVHCTWTLHAHTHTHCRASKAKVLRLEKETREMEKTVEALRHSQAKSAELEKTNKKLYTQAHSDRKDIIKLKEENEVLKVKASRVDKLQVELNSQREQLAEANRLAPKLKVCKIRIWFKCSCLCRSLYIMYGCS